MQYWYTEQLRNYRLQFIRAFANMYVSVGVDSNGNPILQQVPVRYGDSTRIASTIVKGNSENKVLTTPFISCYVSNLNMNAARRQDPSFVSKVRLTERTYDEDTESYEQTPGNRYTVERYMPVPYDLTMQVDVWTSNTDQKEQLLEQILALYNPSIEIQTSVNIVDWTVISLIELQDSIVWSSRTIPVGTDNPIDTFSLTFKIPIWINPPSKVKKQLVIEEIVTNVIIGDKDCPEQWDWTEYEFLSRRITTPGNYSISMSWLGANSYAISLTSQAGDPKDPSQQPTETLTGMYPTFTSGTSFKFNGYIINVTNPTATGVVAAGKAALNGTNYFSIQAFNTNQIKFINNQGGDNVFENVVGQPIQDMGLLPTVYKGGDLSWSRLFVLYGTLKPYSQYQTNASQLRLRLSIDDPNQDIIGWIQQDPIDQNKLIWIIDQASLPQTTLNPINAVINPNTTGPGYGLPPATYGQRYILLANPGESTEAWGDMSGIQQDDIIEFDGTKWVLAWSSEINASTTQYVLNEFNGKLLEWSSASWGEFIRSDYGPGEWRLAL